MKIVRKIFKIIAWSILSLLLFVILIVSLIYVPAVQDYIVPKVLAQVNEGSDMHINLGRLRLSFPLSVELTDVEIMQQGDTMLTLNRANVSVALMPLFKGNVAATGIFADDVFFKSGTPDSITYMRANLSRLRLDRAVVALTSSHVDAGNIILEGGDISIALKNDTTPPTPPTDLPWNIDIESVKLTDIDYKMTMESTILSVDANLSMLSLANAGINLSDHKIYIGDIDIAGFSGEVLTSPGSVDVPESPVDTFPSKPYDIAIQSMSLADADLLYAVKGAKPLPGLDFNYIQLSDIAIDVDSFAMQGTTLSVPLKRLYATERSGLNIDASGYFAMDSTEIRAEGFHILSRGSSLDLSAVYGLTADASQAPLQANLAAEIAPYDIAIAEPSLKSMVSALPHNRKIRLQLDLIGTLADLNLRSASASMAGYWDIKASGKLRDMDNFDNAVGHVAISGNLANLNFVKPMLLDNASQNSINLPPFKIAGAAKINRGLIDGNVKVTSGGGDVALDASWNNRRTAYDINLRAHQFPVNSFMPGLGIGLTTADLKVKGEGLDIFSPKTRIGADVNLTETSYNKQPLRNLSLSGTLNEGQAKVMLASANPGVDLHVNAEGNLFGETYNWTIAGDIADLDLHALGIMDSTANVKLAFDGRAAYTTKSGAIYAELDFPSFDILYGSSRIKGDNLFATFLTNDSTTEAVISNYDFNFDFVSPEKLSAIIARTDSISATINRSFDLRNVDVIGFQKALPPFHLTVDAGTDNFISHYLSESGTSFRAVKLVASNDSIISLDAKVDTLAVGDTRIDNIDFNAYQRDQYLRYRLIVNNEPGTLDEFAKIQANGYIAEDKLSLFLSQKNIQGEVGYNLGAMVTMRDSTFMLKLVPYKPTIAYKNWTVNSDNYIIYNYLHPRIDANLIMQNDESKLHIYTRTDSISVDGSLTPRERLYVDIDQIHIQDWLALNPYAPPMKGDLSAKINIGQAGNDLNGSGTITLADFMYDKRRVGTFDLDIDVTTSRSGTIHANTSLAVDGVKAITASGNLNDSTALHPFLLDFKMIRFPLAVANPFLSQTGTLSGYLNGTMDITGSLDAPRFDGYLNFDSAAVNVAMLGSSFRFTDEKIPVDTNIVHLSDYKIFGSNSNPLAVNGEVDLRSLTKVGIDLNLKANDMQIVNGKKSRKSDVYGKAFISLDASVKGSLSFLDINANLSLNSSTNVSYVISDAQAALASRSNSDLVKFINFNDSTAVLKADSVTAPSSMMNLQALLTIQPGAIVGVDLAQTGNNRVQIQPTGTLDYSMNPLGQQRLTGRINLNKGFARYTPPLMSEKLFDISEGSYISFTGDIMNPQLHLNAVDKLLANVTQEGQNSRLIYFDVGLSVTGTLEQMDIKFDLSTDDDITVQNELQSMSPEQRTNQAMNMLLYNTYTGPNTKANSSLSGNMLYSFLESTVNSWMANNVKGVDISFGVDQYQRTLDGNSSTTTSYSYKVSKSFLDDKIKIVVGGSYSDDNDDNIAESLLNDVSIEYYINKSGTMYVRIFRHTGYESILDGEITQTGVGFVYKRKLRRFRYIFNFLHPKSWHKGTPKAPLKTVEIIDPNADIPQ